MGAKRKLWLKSVSAHNQLYTLCERHFTKKLLSSTPRFARCFYHPLLFGALRFQHDVGSMDRAGKTALQLERQSIHRRALSPVRAGRFAHPVVAQIGEIGERARLGDCNAAIIHSRAPDPILFG